MAERGGLLGPSLELRGIVDTFSVDGEAGKQVMKFVVRPPDGAPVAVEMRGDTLHGVLGNGHVAGLVLPEGFDKNEDRTLRPLRVKNLTTGGMVRVSEAGLRRKALQVGLMSLRELWIALLVILATVLAAAFGLSASESSQELSFDQGPTPSLATLLVLEGLWLVVSASLFVIPRYRRWRWVGGPLSVWGPLSVTVVGCLIVYALWAAA